MARRVVQECDLTKQEYDPAETVTLVIKKSGKKTGRTYELSAEAASKLEQQLVSGNKLPTNWSFSGMADVKTSNTVKTLADLDTDDDKFVAEKKRTMSDEGVDIEPREKAEGQAEILPELAGDGSDCLHINKTGIQLTMKGGKRQFYRVCRDCRTRLPEKTKNERVAYLEAKAPADTREGQSPVAKERNK